jgi:hypothetical protein
MADYIAYVRTNYFRVTDEEGFKKALEKVDGINEIWSKEINGEKHFAFSADYSIMEYWDDKEDDYKDIAPFLQPFLHPEDVIMIQEVGFEKLRYLVGNVYVIGKEETRFINMIEVAGEAAREILNNPEKVFYTDY